MEYRTYNKNNNKVSLLGFGLMRLPLKKNSENIDEATAIKMVDFAIENGINYFDTAYKYHDGNSELFAAKALSRYPRDSFYLADKLPLWGVKTLKDAQDIFEDQLRKCNLDYFDYYLFHAMSKDKFDKVINLGIYDKLAEYKKQGKIKNLGFSFHDTPKVMEWMLSTYEWDFAQIQLNYLDWELLDAKTLYEQLNNKGIQCIIMEPIRGGALASLCEEANGILENHSPEKSIASWAIRYAASLPNVLTVLSGMSNHEQLRDNISTMSPFKPLSIKEQEVLNRALDVYKKSKTIPCTGCRYCMDCPSGVDIPRVFKIMNTYALDKNRDNAISMIKSLALENSPQNCIECGICEAHCPQSISIPQTMKKATQLFKELTGNE